MKRATLIPLVTILLAASGCSLDGLKQESTLDDDTVHLRLRAETSRAKAEVSSDTDPFADAVVENGVNDQGQGFPDPAGILGNLGVLDPAKFPPVTGLGSGGYVVVDMGEGEEILNGPGFDFMVVEADGSLLSAGFGAAEPYDISASTSPTGPFVSVGTTTGSGLFDLESSGAESARYVRIQDAGGFPPSGADIVGVVAFNQNGARLQIRPRRLRRDKPTRPFKGILTLPSGFDAVDASIVLVAGIDTPSPTPPPYISTLDIPGVLKDDDSSVSFNREDLLAESPDGNDVVVTVKLTSTSGEVLYLFSLIRVD